MILIAAELCKKSVLRSSPGLENVAFPASFTIKNNPYPLAKLCKNRSGSALQSPGSLDPPFKASSIIVDIIIRIRANLQSSASVFCHRPSPPPPRPRLPASFLPSLHNELFLTPHCAPSPRHFLTTLSPPLFQYICLAKWYDCTLEPFDYYEHRITNPISMSKYLSY